MNPSQSLKPITRRAIPLFYISPAECMLATVFSGSGSGSSEAAILDIFPVTRAGGPAGLTAAAVSGGVNLEWSAVDHAFSYVIYRAAVEGGPFTLVAANVIFTEYTDPAGVAGNWYKVTGIEENFGETFPSPTVQAT